MRTCRMFHFPSRRRGRMNRWKNKRGGGENVVSRALDHGQQKKKKNQNKTRNYRDNTRKPQSCRIWKRNIGKRIIIIIIIVVVIFFLQCLCCYCIYIRRQTHDILTDDYILTKNINQWIRRLMSHPTTWHNRSNIRNIQRDMYRCLGAVRISAYRHFRRPFKKNKKK